MKIQKNLAKSKEVKYNITKVNKDIKMLSLIKTFPFAINKRSFIIGFIILFFGLLYFTGELGWIIHLSKQLKHPSETHVKIISFLGYFIKLVGYSFLFSFIFIRAKQNAYNRPETNPSNAFILRVFITILCIQLLTDILFFVLTLTFITIIMRYITSVQHGIVPHISFQNLVIICISSYVVISLLISYLLYAFWSAYIMNFNFFQFGYKFLQSLKKPLFFLQTILFSLLYILVILIPIFILIQITGGFEKEAFIKAFASCAMGRAASLELFLGALFIWIPLACIYFTSKLGRWIAVLNTILFFIFLAIIKILLISISPLQIDLPISGILYLYGYFSVFCLIFTAITIIIPSGIVHLLAQSAYQIHKSFDPSIEKKDETILPVEENSKQQPDSLTDASLEPEVQHDSNLS